MNTAFAIADQTSDCHSGWKVRFPVCIDGFDHTESGWPRALRRFAAEAWRRAKTRELADDELYPSDVQWAGLYDRMTHPTPEETARRREIAALSKTVVV